jgi:hypothetical protein
MTALLPPPPPPPPPLLLLPGSLLWVSPAIESRGGIAVDNRHDVRMLERVDPLLEVDGVPVPLSPGSSSSGDHRSTCDRRGNDGADSDLRGDRRGPGTQAEVPEARASSNSLWSRSAALPTLLPLPKPAPEDRLPPLLRQPGPPGWL